MTHPEREIPAPNCSISVGDHVFVEERTVDAHMPFSCVAS